MPEPATWDAISDRDPPAAGVGERVRAPARGEAGTVSGRLRPSPGWLAGAAVVPAAAALGAWILLGPGVAIGLLCGVALAAAVLGLLRVRRHDRDETCDGEHYTATLVDHLPFVAYTARLEDAACLYVSRPIEALLGCTVADALGRARPWHDRVHEEDARRLEAAWNAWRLEPGDQPFRCRYRLRTPGGEIVRIDEVTLVVRTSAGKPVAMHGYLLDVTDQSQFGEDVHQAQRLEAVGRLAGGVAHDFSNLLAVIRGYGDRLSAKLADADRRADAHAIVDAADRGTALVRQLLAFSRNRPLDLRVLDLNVIVDELAPMLRRLIGEDVRLELDHDSDRVLIRADRGQIEQVILNLVVNARDSMPAGGGIAVSTSAARLQPARADIESHAILTVSDTGVGMDRRTRERIFERFFTTKEHGAGSGVGLATVYAIVTAAGGSIAVSSAPGAGTSIAIQLPLADGEPAPASAELEPLPPSSGRGRTVLLVEDEPSLRELERVVLEDAGYTVLSAGNGAQALALGSRHCETIDALVTDVVLPDTIGPHLVTRLAALGCDPPVVFLSGYDGDDLTTRGLVDAGTRVVSKPFREDVLLAELRAALGAQSA